MFSNEAMLARIALISLPLTYLIFKSIFPEYGIYIVEQYGSGPFNRAMLMNIGAAEAMKKYNYSCFIFHDVDLLPEDDRNIYR